VLSRLKYLIGPVALAILLARCNLGELAKVLRSAEVQPVVLAYLVIVPAFLIRAVRWRLLLDLGPGGPSFSRTLRAYAHAAFWGTITPGRLGEFSKVFHARRWGVPASSAIISVALERLLDLCILSVLGGWMLATIVWQGGVVQFGPWELGAVIVLLGLALALLSGDVRRGALAALLRAIPIPRRPAAEEASQRLSAALDRLGRATVLRGLVWTAAAWLVNYYANYLLGVSLGLGLDYLEMAGITALCAFVSLLPVTVMGAGTRDATLILVLATYGIPEHAALALSTLFLSLILWNALLASFLIHAIPDRHAMDESDAVDSAAQ
jgi:uncharacterized protein (TIRG00374 family)